MAHAHQTDFVFRRNGRVHLHRRRRQFSRLLAAEVFASAVVMLYTPCSEVVWRVAATHSIRQFPLHFPSCALPCAITFQLDSTALTSRHLTLITPIINLYFVIRKYDKINVIGFEDNLCVSCIKLTRSDFIRHLPHRNFIFAITLVTLATSLGHYAVGSHSDCNVLLFPSWKSPDALKSKHKGIPYTPCRYIGGVEVHLHSA